MESQGSQASQSVRFVILRHTRGADTHWDLMLELPGQEKLATWRIHIPPEEWKDKVAAVRLPDHRRIYLEYEGEISGGRGYVVRVDEGTAEILEMGERWRVRLEGKVVRGEFEVG